MVKLLPRVILALFFWGVFVFVILSGVPYPDTLTSASPTQLLFFLTPLFFALTLTINIAARFLIVSTIISLGIILILILKALDILNLVSGALTILAIYLFYSYFQRKEALPHFKKNRPKSKFSPTSRISRIRLLKESKESKLQPLKKLRGR